MVAVSSLQQAVPQQKTGKLFIKELKIKIIKFYWLINLQSIFFISMSFAICKRLIKVLFKLKEDFM